MQLGWLPLAIFILSNEMDIRAALRWSDPERDVALARNCALKLLNAGELTCVWSGRPLRANTLDVDHCFPWSAWPCDHLWNLMPTHKEVAVAVNVEDVFQGREVQRVACTTISKFRSGRKDGRNTLWPTVGFTGIMISAEMNLAEIIEELPKLTVEERQAIYRQIEELDGEPQFEATEEMRRAIDEATRSLEAGKGIPLEEVRQRFLAKWATK